MVGEIRRLDKMATDGSDDSDQKPGFSLQLADSASENTEIDIALGIRSIENETLTQIRRPALHGPRRLRDIVLARASPSSSERLRVKPWARYSMRHLRLVESKKR